MDVEVRGRGMMFVVAQNTVDQRTPDGHAHLVGSLRGVYDSGLKGVNEVSSLAFGDRYRR